VSAAVLCRRAVPISSAELIELRGEQSDAGDVVIAIECLVTRQGEVIARGPVFDIPAQAARKLAAALNALAADLGVAP